NIHSILPKTTVWTNSYWDEFVSLPAIVPRGPVALLGLGAGTSAHLMLKFWPWLQLIGWEIDPMIIELSRDYFGMSDLEKATESGGSLLVRIGDALSPSATVEGGFAGIVVDLFCDGKVIPQLQEAKTWLQIAKRLMPDGRIMVNCGGSDTEESLSSPWVQNPTVKALCSAFPGQASGKTKRPSIVFPSAARRMDTLNDLLAASDLISLHCGLTNETMHILNADCLQHIKPGAFIVNTGSCQLIDDCALKQLLIDGTIAGCALDGAEGPQWMEAWVREMPNVLILPRSADYSEEVWMEIREKAITMLQSFFFDGVLPSSAISDEDEEISEAKNEDDYLGPQAKDSQSQIFDTEIDESHITLESEKKRAISHHKEPQASGKSVNIGSRSEGRRSRSGKKGKKRPAHRRPQQKPDDLSAVESDSNYSSRRDDDTAMSSRDQVVSSSSRFASPEDPKYKHKSLSESPMEITSEKKVPVLLSRKYPDKLKDGFIVALRARDNSGYHVARQRVVGGGGWILDVVSNATNRDPAAQFLVTFKNKDTMGLRSFVAGGKLLQINRKMEFVFASHSFDVWESWMLDGSLLEGSKLINCRNPSAVLDICIEILAAPSEEDGVT
ncbi:hypothetical protein ACJX0J_005451, partial [Zea mays]